MWIFKQWHLSPSINTKDASPVPAPPQEKNQTAIYRQLDRWIREQSLKEIYAEGCSGELKSDSGVSFNGWKIADLKKVSDKESYPGILTSVPLKLEAKYGGSLHVKCGDDEALVRENNLAFSDARGAIGFMTRLSQYKDDPERVKIYLDGAIEAYKMQRNTTVSEAISRTKAELRKAIERVRSAIDRRNKRLFDAIRASHEKDVAVVFGGMHAAGLANLLKQEKLSCAVIEPVGYQDDEEKLMARLTEELDALSAD
ncbi:MAG: hypothetical protein P4M08_04690 [Oligoflexia bacterium]|nr:hypothetical protein [Oligoflexia bacterium]